MDGIEVENLLYTDIDIGLQEADSGLFMMTVCLIQFSDDSFHRSDEKNVDEKVDLNLRVVVISELT